MERLYDIVSCDVSYDYHHFVNRYYELNVSDTLMNNLKGKIVIEYPVLYVVLRDGNSLKDFPIYTGTTF